MCDLGVANAVWAKFFKLKVLIIPYKTRQSKIELQTSLVWNTNKKKILCLNFNIERKFLKRVNRKIDFLPGYTDKNIGKYWHEN